MIEEMGKVLEMWKMEAETRERKKHTRASALGPAHTHRLPRLPTQGHSLGELARPLLQLRKLR